MHDVIEIENRYRKARSMVARLCDGSAEWRMRVPVDRENDTDMVLTASLDDIPKLISMLHEERRRRAMAERPTQEAAQSAD